MSIDWNIEMDKIHQARAARQPIGTGDSPAIVIIDFQRTFTEHAGCGPETIAALEQTAALLEAGREAGVPIIHVGLIIDSPDDRMLAQRARHSPMTAACVRDNPMSQFHPLVTPQPGDHIVEKTVASAFYRTRLDDLLQELGVDEIILAGTSISGCVRATAMDAAYRSLHVSLVEDCCDDFRPLSREASLWDIADRFGDITTSAVVHERFAAMAARRALPVTV